MNLHPVRARCCCEECVVARARGVHPSARNLPLADEFCAVCGWENDSISGDMCARCVRQEEEAMR